MSSATAAAPIAGQKLEDKFFQIPVDALEPSASNPRKRIAQEELQELAQSISTSGVLQPLTVRPIASDKYEIVIGERRWRAAKLAKQAHVPCLVRMMTAAAALEAQIIENLQRRDVSPLEEAASYEALLKATNSGGGATKLGVSDIAARIGKSPRYVYDRLELLKLTPFVAEALESGKISPGHASELARLDPKLQDDVTRVAARADMSVMQLREFIREAKRGNASPAPVEKPVLQTSAKPAVRHAPRERMDAWDDICSAGSIAEGKLRGLLVESDGGFRLAKAQDMSLAPGPFYAVVSTLSSGDEGLIEMELNHVIRRAQWSGRTWAYASKPRSGDRELFYSGIRVKCAGREWVLSHEKITLRPIGGGMPKRTQTAASQTSAKASLTEIERALKRSLHDVRFQFGLSTSQLSIFRGIPASARSRNRGGEWLAVFVQTSAKRKRGAHGKSRSR